MHERSMDTIAMVAVHTPRIRNFQRLIFFLNFSDYKSTHKETMAMMTTLCDKC